jgi:hypothetical protein
MFIHHNQFILKSSAIPTLLPLLPLLIERYVYHSGWVPLRPSDSDFSQNWKPGTGEIPLLSMWLGANEAQWFRLQPELEACDQGDSPTLTAVGCHRGPVIQTSARIGSLGPGRFLYSHCVWVPLRPSDSDFGQNWKPGTGEIPLLSLWLGVIEAHWFRLRPELEAQDRGDSTNLTVVGCHRAPVIQTSARIGIRGPGWLSIWMIPRGLFGAWITGQTIHTPLSLWQTSRAARWTCGLIGSDWDSNHRCFDPGRTS